MKVKEKEVSLKQFVFIVFIIAPLKMFMPPALMLHATGRDSWILMGIYLFLDLILLLLICVIRALRPDKTYFEILSGGIGKIGAKIVVAAVTVYYFIKLTLMISEVRLFFTMTLFEQMSWEVFIIPVLAMLMVFGIKSMRAVGRTAEIITPFVVAALLLLALIVTSNIKIDNLLPILADGTEELKMGLRIFPIWFGDFSLLIIFLGNIKKTKRMGITPTMISGILSSVVIMFFSLLIFANYASISHLINYGHSISTLTQFSVGSQTYGRFDELLLCVIVMGVLLLGGIYFHAIIENMNFVVGNVKKKNLRPLYSIICALTIYIFSIFVFSEMKILEVVINPLVRIFGGICSVGVPLLLIILSIIGRIRDKRKAPTVQPLNAEENSSSTEIEGKSNEKTAKTAATPIKNEIKKNAEGKT